MSLIPLYELNPMETLSYAGRNNLECSKALDSLASLTVHMFNTIVIRLVGSQYTTDLVPAG